MVISEGLGERLRRREQELERNFSEYAFLYSLNEIYKCLISKNTMKQKRRQNKAKLTIGNKEISLTV